MSPRKTVIRDFVYLDWERVRSVTAQLLQGIPDTLTAEKGRDTSIEGGLEGGVFGILQGKAQSDLRFFRTQNETRSFHHYVYSLMEEKLEKEDHITELCKDFNFTNWNRESFHDGQFLRVTGTIRFMDYAWNMDTLEIFPRLGEVVQSISKANLQKKLNEPDTTEEERNKLRLEIKTQDQQLKELKSLRVGELAEVVRKMYGNTIRVKILPSKSNLDKMLVGSGDAQYFYDTTMSLSQKYGYEVDAEWVTLGQINLSSKSSMPLPLPTGNEMEDLLETLSLKLNDLARVFSSVKFPALSFTPISIYRIVV